MGRDRREGEEAEQEGHGAEGQQEGREHGLRIGIGHPVMSAILHETYIENADTHIGIN